MLYCVGCLEVNERPVVWASWYQGSVMTRRDRYNRNWWKAHPKKFFGISSAWSQALIRQSDRHKVLTLSPIQNTQSGGKSSSLALIMSLVIPERLYHGHESLAPTYEPSALSTKCDPWFNDLSDKVWTWWTFWQGQAWERILARGIGHRGCW